MATLLADIDKNPSSSFGDSAARLPRRQVSRLLSEVLTCGTEAVRRCQFAAEIIFEEEYNQLEEVETQIVKSREMLSNVLALAIVSQCPEGTGISWKGFTKVLTDILSEPEPTVAATD